MTKTPKMNFITKKYTKCKGKTLKSQKSKKNQGKIY
jgi:hypothetical protein